MEKVTMLMQHLAPGVQEGAVAQLENSSITAIHQESLLSQAVISDGF